MASVSSDSCRSMVEGEAGRPYSTRGSMVVLPKSAVAVAVAVATGSIVDSEPDAIEFFAGNRVKSP